MRPRVSVSPPAVAALSFVAPSSSSSASASASSRAAAPADADSVTPFWDHRRSRDLHFFAPLPSASLPLPPRLSQTACGGAAPLLEWARAALVRSLRAFYADSCRRWLRQDAPKEAFNRWVYLQLGTPVALINDPTNAAHCGSAYAELVSMPHMQPSGDPLLPCPAAAAHSHVLATEMRAEIPTRCQVRSGGAGGRAGREFAAV